MKELDKQRVAACFRAGSSTYDDAAVVQKEVSARLVDVLAPHLGKELGRVFEIGCCTGILTELLCLRHQVNQLYLNDLVEEFCSKAQARVSGLTTCPLLFPGDIELLQLPPDLDLVISSSTLQWISALPELFAKIASSLKNDGLLAFSIFSPGTMQELHSLTGNGLPYHSDHALTEMLDKDFVILARCKEQHRLVFPTLRAILRHVRETGVGGIAKGSLGLGRFKEMQRQYHQRFHVQNGLPVTYVSTIVVARRKEQE